jgi:mRNA interferase MazF
VVRNSGSRSLEHPGLKRGDLVTAVMAGDYGKPRPALIVQSDRLATLASVLVCPLTSKLSEAEPVRVLVEPTPGNALRAPSHVMVDKLTAVGRERCRDVIGRLDDGPMQRIDEALALVIGLAD